jgi:hypothetical protein
MWQEGKIKDYHSGISDILRVYIEERYSINAPEMTTDEIMYAMRRTVVPENLKEKLRQILVLADLVKFAKENPVPHEHETSINYAIDFVKDSAPNSELQQMADSHKRMTDSPIPEVTP